uniref:Centriolar satellite-associated tubulin polyglutamylase complex regulator 1 n=1 Tax=Palpitomonas bilix TaxID=652834 RepID=A0A7S3CZS1_9EUKA|mmetsp:Transcript_1618/g.3303  ORF Transcript_1618/g.3303 Transcript_1618/m.3303 type:complete len:257 (+) Transcript_1618:274-1044(+)
MAGDLPVSSSAVAEAVMQRLGDVAAEEDRRMKMSPDQYLREQGVTVLLEKAVESMLQQRFSRPLEFLSQFFASVRDGVHVIGQPIEYVRSLPILRRAFADRAAELLIGIDSATLDVPTIHEHLRLISPNIGREVVTGAIALCPSQVKHKEGGAVSKQEFALLFEVFFVYQEYIEVMKSIYGDLPLSATQSRESVGKAMEAMSSQTIGQVGYPSYIVSSSFLAKLRGGNGGVTKAAEISLPDCIQLLHEVEQSEGRN